MARSNRAPKEPTVAPAGVTEPTPAQQAQADFVEELAEVGPFEETPDESREAATIANTVAQSTGGEPEALDITILVPADTDSTDAVMPGAADVSAPIAAAETAARISAGITVGDQGDVPAELGAVVARAEYPDGSSVIVTSEARKYRRAAPGEPWISTILRGA